MDVPQATIAAWKALVTTTQRLLEAVEVDLKRAGLPELSWYDVLLETARAGEEGIRPLELKDRLLLPQYYTSRLLSRLEKVGAVERRACEHDGRGHVVVLTEQGRKLRRDMWEVYSAALVRLVGERLNPDESKVMVELLGRLDGPCEAPSRDS
jgi:DNA-binding MarR family transcriptional regulator